VSRPSGRRAVAGSSGVVIVEWLAQPSVAHPPLHCPVAGWPPLGFYGSDLVVETLWQRSVATLAQVFVWLTLSDCV